jgi:ubiquinone/menaquinone biosynthesis C-methylase UbiE
MFSDPQKNLEQLKLTTGRSVADLGAGSGSYTLIAAKMVGPSGRVYAIDVMKEMLQKLKNSASLSRIFNVEALWGNMEKLGGTRLADSAVDVALVCNSLFQVEDKPTFALEVKRILKPGGRALVVDWKESFGGMGPQPEHVVSYDDAKRVFEKAGFVFERDISAGAHHYGLIFHK